MLSANVISDGMVKVNSTTRAFWERGLSVKENSAATHVLVKPGTVPSLEVNRQRQVHFETLCAAAFQSIESVLMIILPIRSRIRELLYRGIASPGSCK